MPLAEVYTYKALNPGKHILIKHARTSGFLSEPGDFLLWNPKFLALDSASRSGNSESGSQVPLTRDPDPRCRIQDPRLSWIT